MSDSREQSKRKPKEDSKGKSKEGPKGKSKEDSKNKLNFGLFSTKQSVVHNRCSIEQTPGYVTGEQNIIEGPAATMPPRAPYGQGLETVVDVWDIHPKRKDSESGKDGHKSTKLDPRDKHGSGPRSSAPPIDRQGHSERQRDTHRRRDTDRYRELAPRRAGSDLTSQQSGKRSRQTAAMDWATNVLPASDEQASGSATAVGGDDLIAGPPSRRFGEAEEIPGYTITRYGPYPTPSRGTGQASVPASVAGSDDHELRPTLLLQESFRSRAHEIAEMETIHESSVPQPASSTPKQDEVKKYNVAQPTPLSVPSRFNEHILAPSPSADSSAHLPTSPRGAASESNAATKVNRSTQESTGNKTTSVQSSDKEQARASKKPIINPETGSINSRNTDYQDWADERQMVHRRKPHGSHGSSSGKRA